MAEPLDEWQPVAQAAPSPAPSGPADEWQPVQPQTIDSRDPAAQAAVNATGLRGIWDAFSHGYGEAFGDEPLGMNAKDIQWAKDIGLFRSEERGDQYNPIRAFNEGIIFGGARGLDAAMRTATSLFRGGQAAVAEAGAELGAPGLGRDIAAIPEAFMGSPHPTGGFKQPSFREMTRTLPMARDLGVIGPERPPLVEMKPAEAAAVAAEPGIVPGPERIASAAIKYRGEVFTGVVHSDAFEAAAKKFDVEPNEVFRTVLKNDNENSGFITNAGRYVTRDEALDVARRADQMAEDFPDREHLIAQNLKEDYAESPPPQMSGPPRQRAMAAEGPKDDVLRGPEPEGQPNAWRERFDEFARKVSTTKDAQKVLERAADENADFPAARAGDIPLRQVDDLANAAGVEPSTVNRDGVGRTLKNDNMVRNAMQAMLTARDDVLAASHDVGIDPSPANLMKLEEALQRRNMWVEQVVGHRAEWGRTGNVFQEFMKTVKDEESFSQYLKDKGRSPEDLRDVADAVNTARKEDAAKVLSDLNARQPGWVWYTWVNGLISGLLTHTKYLAANALTMATEHGVTTPLAAAIGLAKKIAGVGADADRVFFGETMAGTYGWISAAPHAIMASARAIRSGVRPAMESEIALRDAMVARGEKIPFTLNRAVNPVTGTTNVPQGKFLGLFGPETKTAQIAARVIGIPGQSAGAIHLAFKLMNEQASRATEAYRLAGQEGLSPTEAQFWARKAEHEANLPPEALQRTIEASYKGTFMGELGPKGKAFQRFVKEVPGLRWLFPFTHIPVNLMSATIEHTPLAVFDESMRNDILGRNGGVKQDKAIARMVVGSSIMGWFTMKALNGEATGDLPRAQEERDQWQLEGKQPNSIRIGNYWVSFQRFGPAGNLASLGANMAQVIHYLQSKDDDAMTKATYHAAEAAARIVVDEVGFQSLANMFEAYHDPDRKGAAWVASTASSFIPFSSLLSQQASFMDPHQRQAKTLIDGLKYRIPLARETILPKRDWSGLPVANPQFHSILRTREANLDPVALEMKNLQIHPGLPEDRISGVKLTPELYDRYAATAGTLSHAMLEHMVEMPEWHNMPAVVRETAMRKMITGARKQAAAAMQMQYPALIEEGVRQRIDHITGAASTARPKRAPAALEGLQ